MPEGLELRLLLSAISGPQVRVKLNGSFPRKYAIEDFWSNCGLTPQQLAAGRNLMTLDDSLPLSRDKPITLENVEIHIRYCKRSTGD